MRKTLTITTLSFIFLFSVLYNPGTAKAFPVVETNPIMLAGAVADVENAVANTANLAANTTQTVKDTILDSIAYALGDIAIQVITNDIVRWINSGFRGSPSFVQNLANAYLSVADRTANELLSGLTDGFLYGPYSRDIRYVVQNIYYQSTSGSLQNKFTPYYSNRETINAFARGDFKSGGFKSWYDIAASPLGNPYALAFGISQEISSQVAGAVARESQILSFGNGFLSKRECLAGETPPNCSGPIVTPGQVINNQLENALGISFGRLSVADEINEIVGALLTQVVQQALGGAGGLLGASSGGNGRPPITDNTRGGNIIPAEGQTVSVDKIAIDIKNTVDMGTVLQERLSPQQELQFIINETLSCWQESKPNDPVTTSLLSMKINLGEKISETNTQISKNNNQLSKLQNVFKQIQQAISQEDLSRAQTAYDNLTDIVTKEDVSDAKEENKQLIVDTQIDIDFAKQKKLECNGNTI